MSEFGNMVRHGEMVSKANNSRVASATSSEEVGDIRSPQGLVSFDHSLSMQESTPSSSQRSELLQPPKLVSWRSGAASSPKHKRHYSLFDFSANSRSRTLGINNNNILAAAVHDDSPDYNIFGNRIEDFDLRDVPNKSLPSTSPADSCSSHDHQLRNASAAAPESSHVKISSRKSRDWKRLLLPFNSDSLYYHIHHSSRSRPKVDDEKLLARGNSDSKLVLDLQVESNQLQNNNNYSSEKKFMGSAAGVSAGSASAHFQSLGVSVSSELLSGELKTTAGGTKQGVLELPELAARWREIQGSKDWAGLLDPLDLDLRKEIIRYGEFAQMTYDNFDSDSHSKYAGSARFAKQELFERVHNNSSTCGTYQVTRYLYAAVADQNLASLPAGTGYKSRRSPADQAWELHSNWIGFVAVSIDAEEIRRLGRRDVVIAWRGTTVGSLEWFNVADHASWQLQIMPATMTHHDELAPKTAPAHDQPPPLQGGRSDSSKYVLQRPKVVKGFWSLYTSKLPHSNFNQDSPSEQVIAEVRRLLELYKGEELSITITGHGLGGALAILSAYEIGETRLNQQLDKNYGLVELADNIPVTVITFGSPCIGDSIFKSRFEELQLKALRVVNVHDLVPKSIGGGLQHPWGSSYKHVGVELQVNHKLSTYMKHTRDPLDWHNLECYLHLVDGFQGFKSNEFRLVTDRDYSLINKASNVLKDEYCIPGFWWQLENKGLIRNSAGRWVQPNRPPNDDPTLANRDRFI